MSTALLSLAGLQHAQIDLAPDATQRRDAALASARTIVAIADAFDAETAADALRAVTELAKQVETARKIIKEPVLELGKKIDATAKDFVADLETEKGRLSRMLGDYQAAERAKAEEARKAAEAEARRKAEEAAKAAAEAEFATTQAEQDRAQQVAAKAETAAIEARVAVATTAAIQPKGVSVRTVWKFEVTDIDALFKARPDLCLIEPNGSLIRETIKVNQNIPGLRIWNEASASVR